MIQNTKNRIALITGATRGIGKAISILLAKNNIHVIILGRTLSALDDLSDKINDFGGSSTCIQFDLNDLSEISKISQEVKQRWGKLDILISNAAYLHNLTPLSHLSEKDWQISLNTNLSSNWLLIKHFENLLLESEYGRAIFLTSGASQGYRPFWGAYAITKAGLDSMVRAWSSEMEETNLSINLYDPGATKTQMRARAYPGEDPKILKDPDEIAKDILKICDKNFIKNGERLEFNKV